MSDKKLTPNGRAKVKGVYRVTHYHGGRFRQDFKNAFSWLTAFKLNERLADWLFTAYHYFDSHPYVGCLSPLMFRNGYLERFVVHNLITDQGLDYLLDVGLSGATQNTTHYVGIFKGNYTPDGTETGEGGTAVTTVATEVVKTTDIVETARQQWVEAGVSGQAITNAASPAVYTFNATVSVYGMFLLSDATMPTPAAGAKCIGVARFASVRNMVATDVLNITYQISAADDGV